MVWRCIILHRCLVIAVKGTSCTSAASSKEHQHQDARKPNTDTRKPRPHSPAVFSAFSPFLLFLQLRRKRFVTLQLLSIKSAQCLCTAEKKLVVQLSIKTGGRHKMRLHWKSSSWFLICRIVLLFEPSADAARRPAGWCSLAFKVWLPDSRHLLLWIPTETPEWPRNDRRQILNVLNLNRLYWSPPKW